MKTYKVTYYGWGCKEVVASSVSIEKGFLNFYLSGELQIAFSCHQVISYQLKTADVKLVPCED